MTIVSSHMEQLLHIHVFEDQAAAMSTGMSVSAIEWWLEALVPPATSGEKQ